MVTLAQASVIVDQALEQGRKLGLKPLTVVVLDACGHLKAMKREDGSSLMRPDIATGKAWGALGMGFGGRELARRAAVLAKSAVCRKMRYERHRSCRRLPKIQ